MHPPSPSTATQLAILSLMLLIAFSASAVTPASGTTFAISLADGGSNDVTLTGSTIAADTTAPVISAVTAGGITTGSATITWTTDESSDSQVEFGLTSAYGTATTLDAAMVQSHSVGLSGLTVSTVYHYRVLSRDAAANPATGADNTFTTTSGGSVPITPVDDSSDSSGCGIGGALALLCGLSLLAFRRRD